MLKVAQLLKFLQDVNPQKTPARLALYNWLRGCADPNEALTPHLLQNFFWDALDYPHWQSNKTQLGHEVRFVIDQFNGFFQQKFDYADLRWPETIQVIEIESIDDAVAAITVYLNSKLEDGEKVRVIPDQKTKFVAIMLRKDRSLEVRCFDKKFTLRGGILEPLRTDLALFYTPELNLAGEHGHHIEISPHITARFEITNGRVHGSILRGFVFQKMAEMKGEASLAELPRIQLPIRRYEQFFLDRRSDGEYQSLTQKLERTRALVQARDAEARKWAPSIIAQAETALEQVYTGDRLLSLLIRDLKHSLPSEENECPTLTPLIEPD